MTFTRRLTVSYLSTLALVLAACGDSSAGTESGTESSGSAEVSAGESSDGGGPSGAGTDPSGSGSDSGAGTTAAPIEWGPARGISITEVEFNQGTRQDIAVGGDWVGGSGREIYLVKERDSMIRVHYTVPSDWVPHEVEARLHLHYLDGTSETMTQTSLVESSSHPGSLSRTFYFGLQAALGQADPGTKFQVELYEDVSLAQGEEGVWRSPAAGPDLIGFEADPMQLKIVLVPVHYQAGGKDIVAEVNDEDLQRIEDAFYESNPVQDVLLEVHSPFVVTQNLSGLSPLLSMVAQLRAQENPDPNVYYHALLNQGCQFTGCTNGGGLLGQAIDIPGPTMGDAGSRVASSMYYKPDGRITSMSLETMVHEHGHTQGLFHVYCPSGGSQGNDPSYPDPNGKIGAWGFGMRHFNLHSPTASYDYMTYCSPPWFGPWTWNKTYERIRALTSWDFGAAPPDDSYPLLVGAYHEDGSTDWWTMDGALNSAALSATDHVEFSIGGEWVSRPVEVRELFESDAYWIFTPLPGPVAAIDQIHHVEGARTRAVDVDAVNVLHHASAFVSP